MVQIGFKCNKGIVREKNEDACFVIPSHDVYIVADGVGGNSSGEVASRTAVSEIANYVNNSGLQEYKEPDDIFGFFSEAIESANNRIFAMGAADPDKRGMATTIVLAYIHDGAAYIANIGDSRAYLFRSGILNRVTKDHTYVNELMDKGLITEEEAENHRQKNVITKALGADIAVEPDFYRLEIAKDDILVLCSDGLYGEVPPEQIATILDGNDNMNDACTQLVDEALRRGGRDNITVICLKI